MFTVMFIRALLALAIVWCLVEIYIILGRWADEREDEQGPADDDYW